MNLESRQPVRLRLRWNLAKKPDRTGLLNTTWKKCSYLTESGIQIPNYSYHPLSALFDNRCWQFLSIQETFTYSTGWPLWLGGPLLMLGYHPWLINVIQEVHVPCQLRRRHTGINLSSSQTNTILNHEIRHLLLQNYICQYITKIGQWSFGRPQGVYLIRIKGK